MMLLWAAFSLGYFAGVFITLRFFLKSENEYENIHLENEGELVLPDENQTNSPWVVHHQLIRPNYPKKISTPQPGFVPK